MIDIRITPLGETHEREPFSCGNDSVDRYFRNTALLAQRHRLAGTKVAVAVDEPQRVLGFYTLVYFEYRDTEIPRNVARKLKSDRKDGVPVILLAQLGTLVSIHGKGLGTLLLRHALLSAIAISDEIGGVAVIVDPNSDAAERFYSQHGFTRIEPEKPRLLLSMTSAKSALQHSLSP